MIKSVIKLAVILVIGIVAYNYFLGDDQEKEQAQSIVKGTGKAIKESVKVGVGLIKSEYQKFKDGKYDKALDKVGDLLKDAKQKGGELAKDIGEWEDKRQLWKEKKAELMEYIENNPEEDSKELKKKMKDLEKEGKALEKEGKKLNEKADEK